MQNGKVKTSKQMSSFSNESTQNLNEKKRPVEIKDKDANQKQ